MAETTKTTERHSDKEHHEREALSALVGEQVIRTLGEPGDLLKVSVRQLWEGRYRVNVFVGEDIVSARVANSFFLRTDGEGHITTSTPKLTRRY
jgi:hypothetical protein